MTIRYTETTKWNDPWFCDLDSSHKILWLYLVDNCDNAGFWEPNWSLVKFHTGIEKIDHVVFGDRVDLLKNGKWFLKKFVLFQQRITSFSSLNPDNNAHKQIINLLNHCDITIEPLRRGSEGVPKGSCNSKGKGKGSNERVRKDSSKDVKKKLDFEAIWELYPNKIGKKAALGAFNSTVKTEEDYRNIAQAVDNYIQYIKDNEVERKYIKTGGNWFDDWESWVDYSAPKAQTSGRYIPTAEETVMPETNPEGIAKVNSLVGLTTNRKESK